MPTKPTIITKSNTSVDVLNAIRNDATQNYKNYIPIATPDADSVRKIGAIMLDNVALQNEFLNTLINRIAKVIISSKSYINPWAMFKKGILDYGETIEEIFVNMAKPFQYDVSVAENEVFKREMPDVRTAFHVRNYKKFYKITVQQDDLRSAFLSWQGVSDLITKIIDSLYTGMNYDEFQVMKYMIARHALDGLLYPVIIPQVTEENMKSIVSKFREISNAFEFLSSKFNLAGVKNNTLKDNQYIIVSAEFDAKMSVEVLATAFNMDKTTLLGHRVLVDGFGEIDTDRLALLFADDSNYKPLTQEELNALNTIPALVVDRDWWQVYDAKQDFTEQYNAQGIYWNYFLHVWKTFSVSPFVNNALFVTGTPSVTSVTASPDAVSLPIGGSVQISPVVVTQNFASKAVTWETASSDITVTPQGKITNVSLASGTATVTCKSVADPTKTDTITVTAV